MLCWRLGLTMVVAVAAGAANSVFDVISAKAGIQMERIAKCPLKPYGSPPARGWQLNSYNIFKIV